MVDLEPGIYPGRIQVLSCLLYAGVYSVYILSQYGNNGAFFSFCDGDMGAKSQAAPTGDIIDSACPLVLIEGEPENIAVKIMGCFQVVCSQEDDEAVIVHDETTFQDLIYRKVYPMAFLRVLQ